MLLKSTARNRGFQSNAKLISKTNHRKNTGSLSSRARIESQSQISKPDGTSGNTPVENSSTINSMGPKIKLYKPTAGQYTSRGRQEDSTDSKIRIGKESDSLKKASESGFRDSAHQEPTESMTKEKILDMGEKLGLVDEQSKKKTTASFQFNMERSSPKRGMMRHMTRINILHKKTDFFDVVKMKIEAEREKIRKLQRAKEKMSIILASSNFIKSILNAINFRQNKQIESKHRGKSSKKSNLGFSNFYSLMTERYMIDKIITKSKKVKLFSVLLMTLLLFLLTFLTTVFYFYTWLNPLFFENLAESKMLFRLCNLDISIGFSMLAALELTSFSFGNPNAGPKVETGTHPHDLIQYEVEKHLNLSHIWLDEIYGTLAQSDLVDKSNVIKSMFDARINSRKFEHQAISNFTTTNLVLVANYIDMTTQLVENLSQLRAKDYDTSLMPSGFIQETREYLYNILINLPNSFFHDLDIYMNDYNKRIFLDLREKYNSRFRIFNIIYISGIAASFVVMLIVLFKYEMLFLNIIGSYLNLNESEINIQGKILKRYQEVLKYNRFHEENIVREYIECPLVIEELETETLKAKAGGNKISHKKVIKHNRLFPGVCNTIIYSALLLVAFAGFLYLSFIYDSFITKNSDIELMSYNIFKYGLVNEDSYTALTFFTLFDRTFTLHYLPIDEFAVKDNDRLRFITQFTEDDEKLTNLIGPELFLNATRLTKGDICGDLEKMYPGNLLYLDSCKLFNSGVANQGLLNFYYYQSDFMRNTYDKLDKIEGREFSMTGPDIFENKGKTQIWETQEFFEMRITELILGYYFYNTSLGIMQAGENRNTITKDSVTNTVFLFYNVSVVFALGLFMYFTHRTFSFDHEIINETFRIIHSRNIKKNAYIMNKIKLYFSQGLSVKDEQPSTTSPDI